jgi:acyl-coenzyme A synthetase/AMP-(fatty) acid ligase
MYTLTGYWKAETPNIRGGWYITGDTEDNHFSFVGRNDDIITSSGYRIGPFDVEGDGASGGAGRRGDRQARPAAYRDR